MLIWISFLHNTAGFFVIWR